MSLRQLAKAWTKLGAAQYPGIEVAPGAREPASEILIEKHDVTHAGAEVGSWAEARAARERTRVVVEAFMIHLGIAHESDRKKKGEKGAKWEERGRETPRCVYKEQPRRAKWVVFWGTDDT